MNCTRQQMVYRLRSLSFSLSPCISFFCRFLSKKPTDFPQTLCYLLAVNWIPINVCLGDCWGKKEWREQTGKISQFSQSRCTDRTSTLWILNCCFWLNFLGWKFWFFFFCILETVTKCHAKKKARGACRVRAMQCWIHVWHHSNEIELKETCCSLSAFIYIA